MTMFPTDRTEILHNPAVSVWPINGRDCDDVALIALYILQVFHEKRPEGAFPLLSIGFNFSMCLSEAVHFVIDQIALRLVYGNDPKRAVGIRSYELKRPLTDGFDLRRILAFSVGAAHFDELNAKIGVLLAE